MLQENIWQKSYEKPYVEDLEWVILSSHSVATSQLLITELPTL